MEYVFVLYLIANLGPAFTFEYTLTVAIFKNHEYCLSVKRNLMPPETYMRYECKQEIFYQ